MIVSYASSAEADLEQIRFWLERESGVTADRTIERLLARGDLLATFPASGKQVRLGDGRRVYRWSARPYWIYYQATDNQLIVLRIYHQARWSLEQ